MSNVMQRQSHRKQVKSALERIDVLEETLPQVVAGVNQALNQQGQRMEQLASILEAVVELLGTSTVDAKIKEISDKKTLQNLERAKKALEDALAKGEVVKTDKISEKSLVVGREVDKDGNPVFPGRVQLAYHSIKTEFQEKLKGNGVGFVVETANGSKFEVLEVYDVVEKQTETSAPTPVLAETPADLDAALAEKAGA
jgi:hypothetical protein